MGGASPWSRISEWIKKRKWTEHHHLLLHYRCNVIILLITGCNAISRDGLYLKISKQTNKKINKPSFLTLLSFGNLATKMRKESNTMSLCIHDLFTYKLEWEKCNWVVINQPTVGRKMHSLPVGNSSSYPYFWEIQRFN